MRVWFASILLSIALATPALAGDISPQANRELLAANAKKPGVVILPSGLQYRVIKTGSGATPAPDDIVTVAYKGTRVDGYIFDQTKPGETHDLPVNKVIPGWIEVLSLMKEGDEWEVVVPPKLAYGEERSGNDLWGQALTFNIQLMAVKHPRR